MIQLSDTTHHILQDINKAGYEAFVVGGFVRDALLDIRSFDLDICTNAPLDVLCALFKDDNLKINEAYGSLAFKRCNETFEITHYRAESDYFDRRHPSSIRLVDTMIEDVFRRDFTINALMYHPDQGIIDLVGGLDDLNNLTLRTVCKPDPKFSEDPLRIVRLFRFKSERNYSIEQETLQAAYRHMHALQDYKKQWTKSELFKMLMGSYFLETQSHYPECLCTLIPEMGRAQTFNQDNPFHVFNLFDHTLHVIEGVQSIDLKIVALFHDLGKLNTRVRIDNRSRFPGHAEASCEIAKGYLEGWHLESKRRKYILSMIAMHDVNLGDSLKEIAHFIALYGFDFINDLVLFKHSDNKAKSEKANYQIKRCEQYSVYLDAIKALGVLTVRDLEINGQDLINLEVDAHQRKHVMHHLLKMVMAQEVENTHTALVEEVRSICHGLH